MQIEVRSEALTSASQRFAAASLHLDDIRQRIARACALAASGSGDAGAESVVVSFSDRVTAALDDACSRLIDVAGGLRRAVDSYQSADRLPIAADQGEPHHPGGPR
jgi:hypothetical protein